MAAIVLGSWGLPSLRSHDETCTPEAGNLRCFGLCWDDLETMHRDGVLPHEQVVWLLGIVQNEEMRLPTAEEFEGFDEADGTAGWHRLPGAAGSRFGNSEQRSHSRLR